MDPAGNGDSGDYRKFLGLGIELAFPVVAGSLLGHWADGRFGTKPWLLLAGATVGVILGFTAFLAAVLRGGNGKGPRRES